MRIRHIVAYLLGGFEALLLARILLRLLAIRPDNAFGEALLYATAPLVAPFAALNSGQPRYGATLDIASLALFLLLAILLAGLGFLRRHTRMPGNGGIDE
jgi:hypothetical protein